MRERGGLKSHNIDVLAALLLLCAFAMCILSVLLLGTRTYRDITARDTRAFNQTTQSLYVSTKLAQAEGPACVSAEEIGGVSCVRIESDIDGVPYVTRVYCYDGWIRELFTKASYDFAPEDGEKVSEAISLKADVVDDLLTVTITAGEDSLTGNDTGDAKSAAGGSDGNVPAGDAVTEKVYYSLREGSL